MTDDYTHTMTKDSKITVATEDLERMTDSNGDLVQKVARRLLCEFSREAGDRRTAMEWQQDVNETARAAIAAVLDDLVARSWAEEDLCKSFIRGFAARTRLELGLSSPEKPGDAPKAPPGQYAPTEG